MPPGERKRSGKERRKSELTGKGELAHMIAPVRGISVSHVNSDMDEFGRRKQNDESLGAMRGPRDSRLSSLIFRELESPYWQTHSPRLP